MEREFHNQMIKDIADDVTVAVRVVQLYCQIHELYHHGMFNDKATLECKRKMEYEMISFIDEHDIFKAFPEIKNSAMSAYYSPSSMAKNNFYQKLLSCCLDIFLDKLACLMFLVNFTNDINSRNISKIMDDLIVIVGRLETSPVPKVNYVTP